MNKHTYRPDMKSVVERIVGSLAGRRDLDAILKTGGCTDGIGSSGPSAPAVLGGAGLADITDGLMRSYHLRFESTADRAGPYRPMLVFGDRAVAVDVFVRRGVTSGEA